MPILVKDYTWIQTDKILNIKIPLNPVHHEKPDIFTSDSYIKVHFSPFIFELYPLHDIDSEKSKCIVKEDIIVMDLVKREICQWETLEKDLTKPEKMKLKQEILEKCQEEAKQKSEDKKIKKSHLERFSVQRAMAIDADQHALMDARRDAERNKAMEDLEQWKQKQERVKLAVIPSAVPQIEERLRSGVTITELSSSEDESDKKPPIRRPPTPKKPSIPVKTPVRSDYVEKKKEEAAKRVLPRLRQQGVLEIKHTPRTFPTPSRESVADEEQAWLKNITLARRATGFVSEDLRPEEQDPEWCKNKGDEFFRNGNFLGAISAYSHGISLSDKLPSLYANRAATHFALGNFNKCVQDTSSAIDLMKPVCEGNRRSRAKCIARRAAALARLGYLYKAIDEMKAAAKLLPDDESIKKDIYDMERAWEQNPDDH
ncbi:dynein axonemal assembly factor 4-like [Pectinophora gossypiella]|uniref:dynein axonemal assembly factor 4-like n=1 Tax=Pectinophora gossypiella TaxID=13191 RepID=UPI00214E07FB|nr:dynein axonemal assembly factor 4-like [Pectinophora gossypiella]